MDRIRRFVALIINERWLSGFLPTFITICNYISIVLKSTRIPRLRVELSIEDGSRALEKSRRANPDFTILLSKFSRAMINNSGDRADRCHAVA